MDLLDELLLLSEKKDIPYSKKQLEKMTPEKLELIYKEYKRKELDDFNEAMTDVVIFKVDEYLKKYELIKEDSELGINLQNKKLFRKDLKTAISLISPYLPFIGFLEGGVCIASEVVDKMAETPPPENNNKNDKSEEESGN